MELPSYNRSLANCHSTAWLSASSAPSGGFSFRLLAMAGAALIAVEPENPPPLGKYNNRAGFPSQANAAS